MSVDAIDGDSNNNYVYEALQIENKTMASWYAHLLRFSCLGKRRRLGGRLLCLCFVLFCLLVIT